MGDDRLGHLFNADGVVVSLRIRPIFEKEEVVVTRSDLGVLAGVFPDVHRGNPDRLETLVVFRLPVVPSAIEVECPLETTIRRKFEAISDHVGHLCPVAQDRCGNHRVHRRNWNIAPVPVASRVLNLERDPALLPALLLVVHFKPHLMSRTF